MRILENETSEPGDSIARLFRSRPPANDQLVTFVVEPLGNRWWIVHRTDGKSGGIFDDRHGAMQQAIMDARPIQQASIEVVHHSGARQRMIYNRGVKADADGKPSIKLVT